MIAQITHGYTGIGQQTSDDVFEDNIGSPEATIGAISMLQSSTKSGNGVSPQGVEFEVGIRAANQSDVGLRQHVEYMVASYDFDGTRYFWRRVRTLDSSNGGAPIDWRTLVTGSNTLQFYSIRSHEQSFRPASGIITLNVTDSILENTPPATTRQVVTNEAEFTPTLSDSRVYVRPQSRIDIGFTTATSLGARVFIEAYDGASWSSQIVASYSSSVGATAFRYQGAMNEVLIAPRDAGKVKLRLSINTIFPNLACSLNAPQLVIQETFNPEPT